MTSIDFIKALNSVKRGQLIKSSVNYKVHPKVINAISKIYSYDLVNNKVNEEVEEDFIIPSCIRQEHTGSMALFKLIKYLIIKKNSGPND